VTGRRKDRLMIPAVLQGSYIFRAEFTRSAPDGYKTVGFILPLRNKQVLLAFDYCNR